MPGLICKQTILDFTMRNTDNEEPNWQRWHWIIVQWMIVSPRRNIPRRRWKRGVWFGIRWRGCGKSMLVRSTRWVSTVDIILYKRRKKNIVCTRVYVNIISTHSLASFFFNISFLYRHQSTYSKNIATTIETTSLNWVTSPPSYNYRPIFDYVPLPDWFPHVISWLGWHSGHFFVHSIFDIRVCRCILLSLTFGKVFISVLLLLYVLLWVYSCKQDSRNFSS